MTPTGTSAEHDAVLARIAALELPSDPDRRRLYKKGLQLPYPLGYLLRGVVQRRNDPAAFVASLTWFFEAAWRFLLASALGPLVRRGQLGTEIEPFLANLLNLPDRAGRNLTLGAWRDLTFGCLRAAVRDERVRRDIPRFLTWYADRPNDLARLDDLYKTFVSFRNRLTHGAIDGNRPDLLAEEAELYERALVRFLKDMTRLHDYQVVLVQDVLSDGQPVLVPVEPTGHLDIMVDPRPPAASTWAAGRPQVGEVLLAELDPRDGEELRGLWSMHPFFTLRSTTDAVLMPQLFRQYVREPRAEVLFDAATSSEAGDCCRHSEPELLALVEQLATIVLQKLAVQGERSAKQGDALAQRVAEEEERERRERMEEQREQHERRLTLLRDRIPYPRDPLFQGRQSELDQVMGVLRERGSLQIRSYLYGMGGVGKTALAVELCYRVLEEHLFGDGVVWYRVREHGVAEIIREVGSALRLNPEVWGKADPETQLATFRAALAELDVLIVLDNADFGGQVMDPLLALFAGCPLLITSRREIDMFGAVTVQLGGLGQAESQTLVRTILAGEREADAWAFYGDEGALTELCDQLTGLPLGLKLAAYYMRRKRMPIRRFLKKWQTARLSMLQAEVVGTEARHRDIRACFSLSWDLLSAADQRVLSVMSMWDGREMSLEHLGKVLGRLPYDLVAGHDGAVTAGALGEGFAVTGGDDGRVILWVNQDAGWVARAVLLEDLAPVRDLVLTETRLLVQDNKGHVGLTGHKALATWDPLDVVDWRWQRLTLRARLRVKGDEIYAGAGEGVVLLFGGRRRPPRRGEPLEVPEDAVQPLPPADLEALGVVWAGASGLPVGKRSGGVPDEVGEARDERLHTIVFEDLVATSLVDERLLAGGVSRVRLHALVSEFAGESLDAEECTRLQGEQQDLYIKLLDAGKEEIAQDERNITSAVKRFLKSAPQKQVARLGAYSGWRYTLSRLGLWPLWHDAAEACLRAAVAEGDEEAIGNAEMNLGRVLPLVGREAAGRAMLTAGKARLRAWSSRLPLETRPAEMLAWVARTYDWFEDEPSLRGAFEGIEEVLEGFGAHWSYASTLAETFYDVREGGRVRALDAKSDSNREQDAFWTSVEAMDAFVDELELSTRETHLRANRAWALAVIIEHHLVRGRAVEAGQLVPEYEQLCRFRKSQTTLAWARSYAARVALLEGRLDAAASALDEARGFLEPPPPDGPPHFLDTELRLATARGELGQVRRALHVGAEAWGQLRCITRTGWHVHRAVWDDLQGGPPERVRAEAALARVLLDQEAPTTQAGEPAFDALCGRLQLTDDELETAARARWGEHGRPRVVVREPDVIGKRLLPPNHLRHHPVTVGELKSCCEALGLPLPAYYRLVDTDPSVDEPARFVPPPLARKVVRWLGERLPGHVRWEGLPAGHPSPHAGGVAPDISELVAVIWAGWPKASTHVEAERILRSDRLVAFDKWRLWELLRSGGSRSPATDRMLAGLASTSPPSDLNPAHLALDLATVAWLAGRSSSPAFALWADLEEERSPSGRADAQPLAAVAPFAGPPEILGDPSSSWAHVLVWPCTWMPLHQLDEEAPTWP